MRTCFLDLHVSDENLAVGKVERFDAENQKAVTRGLREVILGKILGEIRGKRGGRRVVVAGHHAILHRGSLVVILVRYYSEWSCGLGSDPSRSAHV
jgi:hypothetical protein